jgi:hypothetical protein
VSTPRETAWNEFVDWCGGRGLNAMPAHPWTVAAYIRWLEHRASPTAIHRIVRAIARQHREKSRKRPERHPTVARTLRGVELRAKERRRRRAAGPSLFPEEELVPATAKAPAADAGGGKRALRKATKKATAKKTAGNGAAAEKTATKTATKKAAAKKQAAKAPAKPVRPMRQTPRLVRKRKLEG